MLAGEILLSSTELARTLDRALPLEEPDRVRHRVLRRDADAQMNMIAPIKCPSTIFDSLREASS